MLNLMHRNRPKAGVKAVGGGPVALPDETILRRLDRAEKDMNPYVSKWDEALAFFDNDQWVERSAVSGELVSLEAREGGSKPRWRPRLTRNRYTPAIERARSRYAARFPVPQCTAPNHNQEAINAAKLGEKALLSAYRKLRMKQLALDTMVYTFNCGAGYVWPYWDGDVGPFITAPPSAAAMDQAMQAGEPIPAPELLREGEIAFWLLAPRDVMWEPGVEFEKSRWHAVRKAQPVHDVLAREDYTGPETLTSDAVPSQSRERGRDASTAELVFVYHYLERPSRKHQKGRWIQMANGAEIAPRRDYPHTKDAPVIHELADIRRPHRARPLGRGELLVDVQRTYHRTINQIVAWKNLVLNPQMLAPKGSLLTPKTSEPGLVMQYRAVGGNKPEWLTVPEIPVSLFKMLDVCIADFEEITGDGDLGATESGSQVAQLRAERDESRRATFAENLAVFYASVFEHVLYLMQQHYTEPRLLEVKTRFGTESIPDFLGAKLDPGITVNVDPGSVMPRTREAQEAKLLMYAQNGWIPPHQVMAALRAGDADALIDEYELDVARAQRQIQQLLAMGRGEGPGPAFAAPMDNHAVFQWVIGAWMKTEDFERQDELVKQATMALYEQHTVELQLEQQQQLDRQAMFAQQRGVQSASGEGQDPQAGGEGGEASPPQVNTPSLESTVRGLQGAPRTSGSGTG